MKPKNVILENVFYIFVGALAAFLFMQALGLAFDTEIPVVSVVSGSMRHDDGSYQNWVESHNLEEEVKDWPFTHGLKEGDMIVILGNEDIQIGDVIVYESPRFGHPIIHRVIEIQEEGYVTKGDNNLNKDPQLVKPSWVKGKAKLAVPVLGLPRMALQRSTGL